MNRHIILDCQDVGSDHSKKREKKKTCKSKNLETSGESLSVSQGVVSFRRNAGEFYLISKIMPTKQIIK